MAQGKIDYNALGQAIDTTWGRASTPKTASYSVKFSMQGNKLIASYAAIVNFGTEREMIMVKRSYVEESISVIAEAIKGIKANYKQISSDSLSTKEVATSDSLEIIGYGIHNPKRTAYYRRKTIFEIGLCQDH